MHFALMMNRELDERAMGRMYRGMARKYRSETHDDLMAASLP